MIVSIWGTPDAKQQQTLPTTKQHPRLLLRYAGTQEGEGRDRIGVRERERAHTHVRSRQRAPEKPKGQCDSTSPRTRFGGPRGREIIGEG
ncbi:unnamed protein product, partial [Ectocarpus sp. 12 AP-2014]